jgi:hypothetical protein
MSFAFTYDVPIDESFYRKIQDGLGSGLPMWPDHAPRHQDPRGRSSLYRRVGIRSRF